MKDLKYTEVNILTCLAFTIAYIVIFYYSMSYQGNISLITTMLTALVITPILMLFGQLIGLTQLYILFIFISYKLISSTFKAFIWLFKKCFKHLKALSL